MLSLRRAILPVRMMNLVMFAVLISVSSGVFAQESFFDLEPITAENAARLEVVAVLGIGEVMHVSWSPDGRILAATNSNGDTVLYDIDDKGAMLHAPVYFLAGTIPDVSSSVFNSDGTHIASYTALGWIQTDLVTAEVSWLEGLSLALEFNEDRTAIIGYSVPGYLQDALGMWLSKDWTQALVVNEQSANLIDLSSGTVIVTLENLNGLPVEFSPNGKILASRAVQSSEVFLSNMETGQTYAVLNPGNAGSVMDFSPDGTVLATAGGNNIELWDVATGVKLEALPSSDTLNVIDFSPNGELLAVSGCDLYEHGKCYKTSIQLWNIATKQVQSVFEGPTSFSIMDLSFSPDGTKLASASRDGTARVWDVRTGESYVVVQGAHLNVGPVTFSPDGTRLVSPADNQILIWDATNGVSLGAIRDETNFTSTVIFRPDGEMLTFGNSAVAP